MNLLRCYSRSIRILCEQIISEGGRVECGVEGAYKRSLQRQLCVNSCQSSHAHISRDLALTFFVFLLNHSLWKNAP